MSPESKKRLLRLMLMLSADIGSDELADILGQPKDDIFRDNLEKNVGDKVRLADVFEINYMHDYETKTQLAKDGEPAHLNHEDLYENYAIVSETNTGFTYNCGHCEFEHEADLVIYYPHNGKKYHINSKAVNIITQV